MILNKSLENKIKYSFLITYIVLTLAMIFIIRNIYQEMLVTQNKEQAAYENKLIEQQIDQLLIDFNSFCNSLITGLNASLSQYFKGLDFYHEPTSTTNSKVINNIESSLYSHYQVNYVTIVLKNGVIYQHERDGQYEIKTGQESVFNLLKQYEISTRGRWIYNEENYAFLAEINFIKPLKSTITLELMGYVISGMNHNQILALYDKKTLPQGISSFLYNKNDLIVATSIDSQFFQHISDFDYTNRVSEQARQEGRGVINFFGEPYYYIKTEISNGPFTFISISPLYLNKLKEITLMLCFVSAIIFLGLYFVTVFIAKRLTRPLQSLANHMVQFDQMLPEEVSEIEAPSETRQLITNFNIMIRKNRELFFRIQEEQKQIRQLELALLQSQIKPHFLYNTLDTLYCLIAAGRESKAKKMIKLLVAHYRSVLNGGIDLTTVKEEVINITNYMDILKIRFEDTFEYSINIPGELMPFRIPKLTLQPLIENALYHGIKPNGGHGLIEVDGILEEDCVILSIKDNGIGITDEKIARILDKPTHRDEGFGIYNVDRRLKLYNGEQSGLHVECINEKTMIVIKIYY